MIFLLILKFKSIFLWSLRVRLTQLIDSHHVLLIFLVDFCVHDVQNLVGLIFRYRRCLQLQWTFIFIYICFHFLLRKWLLRRSIWRRIIHESCINIRYELLLIKCQWNIRKINESRFFVIIRLPMRFPPLILICTCPLIVLLELFIQFKVQFVVIVRLDEFATFL